MGAAGYRLMKDRIRRDRPTSAVASRARFPMVATGDGAGARGVCAMATAERTARMRASGHEIPVLLDAIEADGAAAGVPPTLLTELRLCLDELLVNVVNHAAPGPEAVVTVHYRLGPDGVWAEIVDPGPPFDPLSLPDPDVDAPIEARVPGGLGIYFVRRLMDEVVYERRGAFNRLRLVKRAGASPTQATF